MTNEPRDCILAPYDPTWLVGLAVKQAPELVEAFSACVVADCRYHAYHKFVDTRNPNKIGSAWQFSHSAEMIDNDEGGVVVDVLSDGRIGGVEFLKRIETT